MVLLITCAACNDAEQRGRDAGQQLIAMWGDTAAMHNTVAQFDAQRDSQPMPWQRKAMNRGIATVLRETGRDSLFQASMVIALNPVEFAQLKCPPMVAMLMERQFETDSVIDYMSLLHWLCQAMGRDRHAAVLDSTLDACVNKLSLYEQMCVYTQASHPADLGVAMAMDANHADADSIDHNKRLAILRQMYTTQEYAEFEQAYNNCLIINKSETPK